MCMVPSFGISEKATGYGFKIFGDSDCSGRYLCTTSRLRVCWTGCFHLSLSFYPTSLFYSGSSYGCKGG